jgi:hypothetical protein
VPLLVVAFKLGHSLNSAVTVADGHDSHSHDGHRAVLIFALALTAVKVGNLLYIFCFEKIYLENLLPTGTRSGENLGNKKVNPQ